MAITKNRSKGKCPFRNLKPCSEECAINIMADNLEAMHNRTYMMQKELGETKNVVALKILSDIGSMEAEETVNKAFKMLNLDNNTKLVE